MPDPCEIVGLGPCDAPEYVIVLACAAIGVERPADVPWHRGAETERHCCVGLDARPYRFTMSDRSERTIAIGQCATCKTVYWDE